MEARAGGTCVVRVVQSLFASTDDWDEQLTGAEKGWPGIFRVLRLYLTHFRGQHAATMQLMVPIPGTPADAWAHRQRARALPQIVFVENWFEELEQRVPAQP